MNNFETQWADMPIGSPSVLRTLIMKLKESVESGEMQQYWPTDAPFVTAVKIADVPENGPWPADYIEWYFYLAENKKLFKLSADTYHGAGGYWQHIN